MVHLLGFNDFCFLKNFCSIELQAILVLDQANSPKGSHTDCGKNFIICDFDFFHDCYDYNFEEPKSTDLSNQRV